MKILMIPSWYATPEVPLLGTFFKEQAEALAERGMDVAVLYADVGRNTRNAGMKCEMINGVLTYRYIHPNYTPRWEKGRALQRTSMYHRMYKRLEREWGRPDVINLRSSLQGYEALALCKEEKLPLFFMEHSSFVVTEGPKSRAVRRLHAVMDYAVVNACVGTTLHKVMNPYKSTRIIPDFVDGDRFFIKPVERDRNTFIFHAMGQLRPIKGHDTLIRAFAKLKTITDKPVELRIAGTGELHDQLAGLIQSEGVADSCTLAGVIPREQAVDFMNGCDCFICSSRREMLSCVLHECAACGKPAIGTMCGGPQDIITDETGMLVPVDDIDSMAQAMLRMMDEAKNYDPQKIRESILARFGKETVCRQLIAACEEAREQYGFAKQ